MNRMKNLGLACRGPECSRGAWCRGLCQAHYWQFRAKGALRPIRPRHGMNRTPEAAAHAGMLTRCYNQSVPCYPRYGGRGIRVCERWHTAAYFIADMGRRPSPAHSLDRINNDGDYEPGNCRWATAKEQSNNRSSARLVMHQGVTRTIGQWLSDFSLSCFGFYWRLACGKTEDVALEEMIVWKMAVSR